jgi:hypothetical protein
MRELTDKQKGVEARETKYKAIYDLELNLLNISNKEFLNQLYYRQINILINWLVCSEEIQILALAEVKPYYPSICSAVIDKRLITFMYNYRRDNKLKLLALSSEITTTMPEEDKEGVDIPLDNTLKLKLDNPNSIFTDKDDDPKNDNDDDVYIEAQQYYTTSTIIATYLTMFKDDILGPNKILEWMTMTRGNNKNLEALYTWVKEDIIKPGRLIYDMKYKLKFYGRRLPLSADLYLDHKIKHLRKLLVIANYIYVDIPDENSNPFDISDIRKIIDEELVKQTFINASHESNSIQSRIQYAFRRDQPLTQTINTITKRTNLNFTEEDFTEEEQNQIKDLTKINQKLTSSSIRNLYTPTKGDQFRDLQFYNNLRLFDDKLAILIAINNTPLESFKKPDTTNHMTNNIIFIEGYITIKHLLRTLCPDIDKEILHIQELWVNIFADNKPDYLIEVRDLTNNDIAGLDLRNDATEVDPIYRIPIIGDSDIRFYQSDCDEFLIYNKNFITDHTDYLLWKNNISRTEEQEAVITDSIFQNELMLLYQDIPITIPKKIIQDNRDAYLELLETIFELLEVIQDLNGSISLWYSELVKEIRLLRQELTYILNTKIINRNKEREEIRYDNDQLKQNQIELRTKIQTISQEQNAA